MTGNDAKKLKRAELLELLIEQTEENQRLTKAISKLEEQLSQRVILMEEAGSIAEAALGLSKVFAQAQDAADRYLESVRQKEDEARVLLRQTEEACRLQLEKTQAQCEEMERQTRMECEKRLAEAARPDIPGEPKQLPEEPPEDAHQGLLGRFRNRR